MRTINAKQLTGYKSEARAEFVTEEQAWAQLCHSLVLK
jgi:hypothetical protein